MLLDKESLLSEVGVCSMPINLVTLSRVLIVIFILSTVSVNLDIYGNFSLPTCILFTTNFGLNISRYKRTIE